MQVFGYARVLCFALLITGCVAAEPVPLSIRGTLATVEVRLNGKGPFRMLIDTGATACSFSAEAAKAIGATPQFRVVDLTPGNSRVASATDSVQVELGNHVETRVQFSWQESVLGSVMGLQTDGVLGQSFLSRFDYTLDYRAKRILLDEEKPAQGKQTVRVAFERADGRMIVKAANREDGAIRLVLDSAASHLSLWRSNTRVTPNSLAQALTYAGRRSVAMARMSYLAIGGDVIRGLDVLIPEETVTGGGEDGLLPASLFRSVYVSNSKSYVEFTR